MRIGELAARAGVSTDALRLYERQGLIRADRRANGYRDFPDPMLQQVHLIRLAQSLGFKLAEIGNLMRSMEDALDAEAVAAILREKRAEVDARIAGLQKLGALIDARLEQVCPLGLGSTAQRDPAPLKQEPAETASVKRTL